MAKLDKVSDTFGTNANGSLTTLLPDFVPWKWGDFVANWSTAPSTNSTTPTTANFGSGAVSVTGTVYNYATTVGSYSGDLIYRFVPSTYTPQQDAFFTTYINGALSGFITSRASS